MLPKIISRPKSSLCHQKYLFYNYYYNNSLQNSLCHPNYYFVTRNHYFVAPKNYYVAQNHCHRKSFLCHPKIFAILPKIITLSPAYTMQSDTFSTNAIRITSPCQSPCSNTKSLSYDSSIALPPLLIPSFHHTPTNTNPISLPPMPIALPHTNPIHFHQFYKEKEKKSKTTTKKTITLFEVQTFLI